jgi:hypothetical protein
MKKGVNINYLTLEDKLIIFLKNPSATFLLSNWHLFQLWGSAGFIKKNVRRKLSGFNAARFSKTASSLLKIIFFSLEYILKQNGKRPSMLTFLLWLILFILCWPIALAALILYPIVWLLLLPFRLLGFAIDLSFDLVRNLFMLPFRLVGMK